MDSLHINRKRQLAFIYVAIACVCLFCTYEVIDQVQTDLLGDRTFGFTNLTGDQAIELVSNWPGLVNASDVHNMSHECNRHSSWERIELDSKAAVEWERFVHAEAGKRSNGPSNEGVRRHESMPLRQLPEAGVAPSWWSPPAGTYQVTETMTWHERGPAVACVVLSFYDCNKQELWVYQYVREAVELWVRGRPSLRKRI